jgi:nitronate monooxygenase
VGAGLHPDNLPPRGAIEIGKDIDISARESRPKRWRDIWSGGHSTSGVTGILTVDDLVAQTAAEYRSAVEWAKPEVQ